MPRQYNAFGLKIASEIELPLPEIEHTSPDTTIKLGDVPDNLENAFQTGLCFQLTDSQLLLRIDGIATFWIKNGSSIIVQPLHPKTTAADLSVYLLGSSLGAILDQRGVSCLHSSAVSKNDECVLFLGKSGAGKSTMATALARRGFDFLTDDICPLKIDSGKIHACPGYPMSKLWPDSLHHLDLDPDHLPHLRQGISKRRFPIETAFSSTPRPVSKIFLLSNSTKPKAEILPLQPIEALATCKRHSYRPIFKKPPERQKHHFETLARLAQTVPAYHILRPKNTFDLDALIDEVNFTIQA
ncbi:hypothetical protein VDG1235_4342 [Verrucomicrobiia bacterium DG1235]|nr:hypothetical protein VDG1235_4342 [Verrucomicrobiae bacterium DG1235]